MRMNLKQTLSRTLEAGGTAVLLHQVHRFVRQLEQVRVRAIAVGQNRETQFAVSITQQERRVTSNAAAMSEVALVIAYLRPPR